MQAYQSTPGVSSTSSVDPLLRPYAATEKAKSGLVAPVIQEPAQLDTYSTMAASGMASTSGPSMGKGASSFSAPFGGPNTPHSMS